MSPEIERVERVIFDHCARSDDQPGHYEVVARAVLEAVSDMLADKLMVACGGACAGAFEGIIDEALKP